MKISLNLPIAVCGLLVGASVVRGAEPKVGDPLFSRHVIPVFSRLGCNAGACHGSPKGQNGFRLSLYGADPEADHVRLMRDTGGRRINFIDPEGSLLLLKATGNLSHVGGSLTNLQSPEYTILRDWIAAGARLDVAANSRLKSLRVSPDRQTLKPRESGQLRVEAAFVDGTKEDVTDLCTFESTNKDVVTTDRTGRVEAKNVGDAAIVVRFRAEPVVSAVLVPGESKDAFPDVAAVNFIDNHIIAKLRQLKITPSDLSDDATFLRRVSLDVAGELPTPNEIRTFLESKDSEKRAKKIDELLARPGHATLWASKFCDILKPTGYDLNQFTEHLEASRFHGWVRARLQEGIRYDELVERIMTATSREGRSAEAWVAEIRAMIEEDIDSKRGLNAYVGRRTLDLYWQKSRGNSDGGTAPVKTAVQVAHGFLGLRLECAQCHRHPHDIWQQDDLLSFASFFTKVSQPGSNNKIMPDVVKVYDPKEAQEKHKKLTAQAKVLTDRIAKEKNLSKDDADKLKKEADALSAEGRLLYSMNRRMNSEIHTAVAATAAEARSPLGQQKASQFRLLGQAQAVEVPDGEDARKVVMAWMRQPDNPFFARALVNRVWAHYFGRGIVDPPDQLSPLNPPTHPELLQELSDGFVKSGFDLAWLHRTLLNSRTYQLSSVPNATNRSDSRNYARFNLRRLPAESVIDAINHATGGSETFPAELRMPAGAKALDLAGVLPNEKRDPKVSALAYALQIFGRPIRSVDVQCDCERENAVSMVQTIYLVNHPSVREKISRPEGRIAAILKEHADDGRRVDEAFLWALSRMPSPEQRVRSLEFLKGSPSAQQGLEGLLRTLMLSDEFVLNH